MRKRALGDADSIFGIRPVFAAILSLFPLWESGIDDSVRKRALSDPDGLLGIRPDFRRDPFVIRTLGIGGTDMRSVRLL